MKHETERQQLPKNEIDKLFVSYDKLQCDIAEKKIQTKNSCLACLYLFKVSNGDNRTICQICSKSKVKALERRQWLGENKYLNWTYFLKLIQEHLNRFIVFVCNNLRNYTEAAIGVWKKGFAKFTGTHLCRSIYCFPVNFAEFLRTSIFTEHI